MTSSCPCTHASVLGAGCPPHGLAPPGTSRLLLWGTMVLVRDASCQEPQGQRGSVMPWSRAGICTAFARTQPAQKNPPRLCHLPCPLGLPSLCPPLGPVDGGGTLKTSWCSTGGWDMGAVSTLRAVPGCRVTSLPRRTRALQWRVAWPQERLSTGISHHFAAPWALQASTPAHNMAIGEEVPG